MTNAFDEIRKHIAHCDEVSEPFGSGAQCLQALPILQALEAEMTGPKRIGDMRFGGGILFVDLWYPRLPDDRERSPDHPAVLELGLSDVRAADSIRIEYDFARDGYSVKQGSKFSWEADEDTHDADWQEVAFVQAWAREVDSDEGDVETQRILNQINVAHANAKVALAALPPADPDRKNVLLDISRGQLQAAVGHLEQAWNELSEAREAKAKP
jgi:hypothetical protein